MKKISKAMMGVLCLLVIASIFLVSGCHKKKANDLTTIRLGEVTHSPFYAPLYVSIHNGYFEEVGIEIELSMISGANNVSAAVLSKDIDVGFCGPEATIYIYNGGENDYLKTFAGLTRIDGQFLVTREEIDNFEWKDLQGMRVLAGRIGGMPELNFENALKNAGLKKSDLEIDTSIDFASLVSAFISGEGDAVNLFEPQATMISKMGYGHVVASIGEKSGEMPYTAFNARASYLKDNEELLKSFTRAIAKGLEYCQENSSEDIARVITSEFKDTSINDLVAIVERYKTANAWLKTPFISEEMFENLEDIMIDSKQIDKYVPYSDLIDNLNE